MSHPLFQTSGKINLAPASWIALLSWMGCHYFIHFFFLPDIFYLPTPTPQTHNHNTFVRQIDYLEEKDVVYKTGREKEFKSRYSYSSYCPFVLFTNSGFSLSYICSSFPFLCPFFQTQLWVSLCVTGGHSLWVSPPSPPPVSAVEGSWTEIHFTLTWSLSAHSTP